MENQDLKGENEEKREVVENSLHDRLYDTS